MAANPIYVEGWDPSYGASARFDEDVVDGTAVLVEDGDRLMFHSGRVAPPDAAIAFIDGVRRTEGFLSFVDPASGDLRRGLVGAYGVGAAIFEPGTWGRYDHITTRRLAVICGGHRITIPDATGGWHWDPVSIEDTAVERAEMVIHEQMRLAEVTLGRRLGDTGALTVVDGNLNYVRSIDGRFIGCVKTHRQLYLDAKDRCLLPGLPAAHRTSLFTVREDCYSAYLRLTARGPHDPPLHGVVRIEVPQGLGLAAAIDLADVATGTLPRFAGVVGHDPRAPQNLQPVGALERRLRHLLGPSHFALRALREAVATLHAA